MVKVDDDIVINVENLCQKVNGDILLDNISFQIKQGEGCGIFGLRASGKTTLLHILAGVDRFTSGTVEVLGHNVQQSQKFKKHIGLVTQTPSLFKDLRAGENLDFIATLKKANKNSIDDVILRLELKDHLREPVNRMEVGVFQRLSLACALLGEPKLLFLDNLIKDLDIYSRYLILKELARYRDNGGTTICGFSNIEVAELMDRVGWLEDGNLTFYEPSEAMHKWQVLLDEYFPLRDSDYA